MRTTPIITNQKENTMQFVTHFPTIKIDRNIPLPPKRHKTKYPWADMQKGDSFLLPEGLTNYAVYAIVATKRYKPKEFVARRVEENGVKVTRIWRVK